MTQSWFNIQGAVFQPAWSVSTEWFFYLAFIPLTMIVVTLRRPILIFIVFGIASIIGLGIAFALWRTPISAFAYDWFWHGEKVSYDPWGWSCYFSPYLRVLDFISGMLMAQAYRMREVKWLPRIILPFGLIWCGIMVMSSWLPAWTPLENLVPNFIFVPAIAPVMLHLCKCKSWLSRALSTPTMLFLGEISYSIYIWSFFIMAMLKGVLDYAHPMTIQYFNSGLKVIVISALTIVMAYGSYSLIEVPARRWIRDRGLHSRDQTMAMK